jgi:hypothetical protein
MGLSECNPHVTPLEPGVKLEVHPLTSPPVSKEFRNLKVVGTLLYLVNCIRPDMAHAVGILCRYNSHPGPSGFQALPCTIMATLQSVTKREMHQPSG